MLSDILSGNINKYCGIDDVLSNISLSKEQLIKIKFLLEENFGFRRYNFNPTGTLSRLINIIEVNNE